MRRRLFWTIALVAAVTGFLVLVGTVVASQRAAVEATYREMSQSADEAVAIIEETIERAEERPGAGAELFRFLQGGQLGPSLGRIRRTAGSSEIAFMVIVNGEERSSAGLFERVTPDLETLSSGASQFTRSTEDELVVITQTDLPGRVGEVSLLVALARETPVVRVSDQRSRLVLIVVAITAASALLARLLSRQLASRLEPLAGASRRLAEGDLGARVPDLGDEELDEVAGAFNEMAGELEASRDREREFILGVGHDLRTPLTTIGGYSEALESGDVSPDEVERIGGVLGVQTRQMGRLIEDLTTLARLQQPEFGLRLEPVDIGAHVAEVAGGFERRAREVGVSLSVETEDGLMVDTDPDRLSQIAQNLVENALRFTPETGSVKVTVSGGESQVVIEVADSGVGIPEEDLPHVFDRHYMVRQRRVRNEGSGLGLSIVQGLVDRMGGTVSATSQPGKGTTITVRLSRTVS